MTVFVDASAIVAILTREPFWERLADALERSPAPQTSPIKVWEASLAVARLRAVSAAVGLRDVSDFVRASGLHILPITAELGDRAVEAHCRFGKGRHPAALNMGDCFAYACAAHLKAALLFVGDDLPQTDISSVLELR